MKRRILAMLLAMALVLTYTPGLALASQTEQDDTVAMIGEVPYTSLEEAVIAGGGGEITLLQDVTLTEVIEIDKDITILGNGHTVTSSANRIFRITASEAVVQMDDLNLVSTAARTGTEDIRGISVDPNLNAVTLTLNNCSVDFDDTYGQDWAYAVNVCDGCTDVTITITGGTYEGANVINVYGENPVINISNATLKSLYAYNDSYYGSCVRVYGEGGAVTTQNVTFQGDHAVAICESVVGGNTITHNGMIDSTSISVKDEEDLVEAVERGGTIKLLDDIVLTDVVEIHNNIIIIGNGHSITSSANRIFRVAKEMAVVTMEYVELISTAERSGSADVRGISIDPGLEGVQLCLIGCSVVFTEPYGEDWAYAVNVCDGCTDATIQILGGTYEGANVINIWGDGHTVTIDGAVLTSLYVDSEEWYGAGVALEGEYVELTVKNTIFNGTNAKAISAKYEETHIILTKNNTDNTKLYEIPQGPVIAIIDGTVEVNSVAALNEYLGRNPGVHEVVLQAEITVENTEPIVIWGTNVTLDMNGYSISNLDAASVIHVQMGGATLKNGVVNGHILIGTTTMDCWVTLENTLTVYAGVNAPCVSLDGGCTLTSAAALFGWENIPAIESIGSPPPTQTQSVTITGGSITCSSTNGDENNIAISLTDEYSLEITDGYITGDVCKATVNTVISGGTFSHDPSAYVKEGYEAVASGNTWTVSEKIPESPYEAEYNGQQYDTLAEAIAAVPEDAVLAEIVLTKNVVLEGALTIEKSLHLELNGYTLSRVGTQATDCTLIIANSDVVITDASEGNTGKVAATGAGTAIYVNKDAALGLSACVEGADLGAEIHGRLTLNEGGIGGTKADADGAYVYNDGGEFNGQLFIEKGTYIGGGENGTAIVMHKDTFVYTAGLQICYEAFRIYGGELYFEGSTMGSNGIVVTTDHENQSLVGNASVTVNSSITAMSGNAILVENPANIQNYSASVCVIDGYIDGKISYGENVSSGIEITGGMFPQDPSAFVADGYVAALNGSPWYTIEQKKVAADGDKTENGNDVVAGDAVGDITVSIEGIDGEAVADAVNSNENTGDALVAEAKKVEVADDQAAAYKETAVEQMKLEETEEVSLEVRPYLDVKITDFEEVEDGEEVVRTMTVEIEPKYDVVAVAEKKEMVVAAAQKLEDVKQPVSITVPIPDAFLTANYVYVKHIKSNGEEYTYTATVDKTAKTATFLNPNGFSTFEFYTSETLVETDDLIKFYGTNLTLGQFNDISFFVEKSELEGMNVDELTAHFFMDRQTQDRTETAKLTSHGNSYYRVRFTNVAAAEMCDEITVVLKDADGNVVSEEMTITMGEAVRDLYDYTSGDDAENWKNLCVAMLKYGDAAQIAFNYNINDRASQYLPEGAVLIYEAATSGGVPGIAQKAATLPAFYGTNLTLGQVNDISFFMEKSKLEGMNVDELTAHFFMDRQTQDRTETAKLTSHGNSYYRVRFTNVAAAEMCDEITVVLKDADGNVVSEEMTITMGEAVRDLYDYTSGDDAENWKNLCVAMLKYGDAAQIAFNYNVNDRASQYLPEGVE